MSGKTLCNDRHEMAGIRLPHLHSAATSR